MEHPVATIVSAFWFPFTLIDGIRLVRGSEGVGDRLLLGGGKWRVPSRHYRLAGAALVIEAGVLAAIVVSDLVYGKILPVALLALIPVAIGFVVAERVDTGQDGVRLR